MFNVPQWMIEEFKIVEIIEHTETYAVGVNAQGTEYRFEPSIIGSSISVSW